MTPGTALGPQPTALHRHALRLLARLHRRPVPVRPSRASQLRALTTLLDEAVAAQSPADRAVAACGEPGPLSGQAAQEAGRQSRVLHRLHGRMRDLVLTETDLVHAQQYAGRLLAYDQWMVRQAMDLAFTSRPQPRIEAARLCLNGLGRPADDLRRLRDALRSETDGDSPSEPCAPTGTGSVRASGRGPGTGPGEPGPG
ncbi:hypothetical protein OG985_42500 [Streptomyces sp. NBC_00289]|uniref:hypothetical protein n=1 Tax=Streptomyces sp. NBC_00289 TaxID=2975703 RepID=UPI00324BEA07